MNTKKLSILLAAIVLIAAQLACAAVEPSFGYVRTAKDQDGAQPSTTFSSFDTVYVVGDLSNGVIGNNVTARLYVDNVEGYDPNFFVGEAAIDVDQDNIDLIYFYFEPPTDGWPAGTYKVEVYFNGTLNTTLNYSIL